MEQGRIARKFKHLRNEGRTGIILYITVGYPDMDATEMLVPALAGAGADLIELGVPFSDPLADGTTIQATSHHALKQGVTLEGCIRLVGRLRDKVPETPLILMGYYNPFLSYGLAGFGLDAGRAGVDGVIVPDLPPDEAAPLLRECNSHSIDVINLLAPTSTDTRIEKACQAASGFIYCVSLTGVTGVRDQLPPGVFGLLERVARYTGLPLAVGFGISRRDHIQSLSGHAHAAVVGSGLMSVIMESAREEVVERAGDYVMELSGATPPVREGTR